MGDAEESGEARGVGALTDPGAAEKDPLDVPILGIAGDMEGGMGERGEGSNIAPGSDRGEHSGQYRGEWRGCGSKNAVHHRHGCKIQLERRKKTGVSRERERDAGVSRSLSSSFYVCIPRTQGRVVRAALHASVIFIIRA